MRYFQYYLEAPVVDLSNLEFNTININTCGEKDSATRPTLPVYVEKW
jgi:hypothetical protein